MIKTVMAGNFLYSLAIKVISRLPKRSSAYGIRRDRPFAFARYSVLLAFLRRPSSVRPSTAYSAISGLKDIFTKSILGVFNCIFLTKQSVVSRFSIVLKRVLVKSTSQNSSPPNRARIGFMDVWFTNLNVTVVEYIESTLMGTVSRRSDNLAYDFRKSLVDVWKSQIRVIKARKEVLIHETPCS